MIFRSDVTVVPVNVSGDDLSVARAAWVSTKGERAEDENNEERIEGLINFLMNGRHGTPFEHNSITFLVSAPIFVWREHHRHRIGISYNGESGRYKKLDPVFYVPNSERNLVQVGSPGHYTFVPGDEQQVFAMQIELKRAAEFSYRTYESLLSQGIAREVARMCLPVNIYSSCYVTMNTRSLMNFLSLRTKRDGARFPSFPQREIEMVADRYEAVFKEHFPLTWAAFEDCGRVAP